MISFVYASHALCQESRKVALVIGNAQYQRVEQLPNASTDAYAMADKLRALGFSVMQYENLDRRSFLEAVRAFRDMASLADIALVYYAGHGIAIEKSNYLIPVDARINHEDDVQLETLPLNVIMGAVEGSRALRVVILDACRNNPFAQSMKRRKTTRSIARGLSVVPIEQNDTVVWFAAGEGAVAQDGQGQHSPFTQAILDYIGQPNLEIGRMFRLIRERVRLQTKDRQVPWENSSRGSKDFYFNSNGQAVQSQVASVAPQARFEQPVRPQRHLTIEDEVRLFLNSRLFSSASNSRRVLNLMFADHVMFYGTPKSKAELIELKWDYFNNRWPTRSFDLIENTFQVMPSGLKDEYEVSFNARYDYKGRGKRSAGLAFFDFTMKRQAGRLVVVRENGRVIERY